MTKRVIQNHVPGVFSKVTRALLVKSGWGPDYKGPIDLYVAAYRDENLEFPQAAMRFLSRFGALVVQYKTETGQEDVLDFRAERAAAGSGQGTLAGYEEMAGKHPLCPIGEFSFGMCMLLMDPEGQVFGGTEWSLLHVGNNGEEAIERILTGAPFKVIASYVVTEAQRPRKKRAKPRRPERRMND